MLVQPRIRATAAPRIRATPQFRTSTPAPTRGRGTAFTHDNTPVEPWCGTVQFSFWANSDQFGKQDRRKPAVTDGEGQ